MDSKHNQPGKNPTSTAERLKQQREQQEQQKLEFVENYEEYKRALNGLANTPYGMHILRIWIKAMGIFSSKPGADGAALVSEKAFRHFYLTMIRPHLDTSLRRQLED